jgi:hypothetical protein
MKIETIETREDLEICLDCLNEWYDLKSDLMMHFSSEGELMMTVFSKTPCENCGSKLGGYRFTATRRVCN